MGKMVAFSVLNIHINPWDAHVDRALLESEGIPAYLTSEHIVTAWWPMSFVFGGVRLVVRGEDLEDAQRVLALRDHGVLEAALADEFPATSVRCNRCGSEHLSEQRNWLAIFVAFVLLFVARISFPPPKDLRCASCGEVLS